METGIRFAERRDIPALCEIWEACFHDPYDYIRLFYRENFDHISVPVYVEAGRPVSMLHLLDASFRDGADAQPAKLIYAAGTLPGCRQRGYMRRLLEDVTSMALRDGFALFLKPADASLLAYYRSFGFDRDACLRLVTIPPGGKIPLTVSPLSPEQYNRMRDAAFSPRPYARWPDRHLRWCVADNAYFGGKTLALALDGETHFLMAAPEDGALLITETDLSLPQLRRVSGALCALFGTGLLKAYLPDGLCPEGEEIVSSVVCNGPLRHTYVNLILI